MTMGASRLHCRLARAAVVVGANAAIQAAMRADDLPAQATLTARSYGLATTQRLTIYGVRRLFPAIHAVKFLAGAAL
jgi:hypothetical protein